MNELLFSFNEQEGSLRTCDWCVIQDIRADLPWFLAWPVWYHDAAPRRPADHPLFGARPPPAATPWPRYWVYVALSSHPQMKNRKLQRFWRYSKWGTSGIICLALITIHSKFLRLHFFNHLVQHLRRWAERSDNGARHKPRKITLLNPGLPN